MTTHRTVSREEWIAERKEFLSKEKEFNRLRDQLSQERRNLPWVKVEKEYTFDGPNGKESLSDLFEGRNQLIVYHFMFGPDWEEGCKSCSFLADHYDPAIVHLNHRDVSMVTISLAPLAMLQAYRERMGWNFKWLSSFESDFNYDYHVSFKPEEKEKGEIDYNYMTAKFFAPELPGISVFYKDENGDIFHTYSSYSRGLDMFIGAYHLLDIVPKGRDEEKGYGMAWLRRHDQYKD